MNDPGSVQVYYYANDPGSVQVYYYANDPGSVQVYYYANDPGREIQGVRPGRASCLSINPMASH